MEIPACAFEDDGVVFVGKRGEEPTTVPIPDLTVVGEPFTLCKSSAKSLPVKV